MVTPTASTGIPFAFSPYGTLRHTSQHEGSEQMDIAVIDTEPIVLSTLQDFLSDSGHRVEIFDSPEELTAGLACESKIDVVLVDPHMPGLSSLDLVRRIHSRTPQTPIIIMSGTHSTLSADDAVINGVFAYLRKPVRLAELEVLLVRVLERTQETNTTTARARIESKLGDMQ